MTRERELKPDSHDRWAVWLEGSMFNDSGGATWTEPLGLETFFWQSAHRQAIKAHRPSTCIDIKWIVMRDGRHEIPWTIAVNAAVAVADHAHYPQYIGRMSLAMHLLLHGGWHG